MRQIMNIKKKISNIKNNKIKKSLMEFSKYYKKK